MTIGVSCIRPLPIRCLVSVPSGHEPFSFHAHLSASNCITLVIALRHELLAVTPERLCRRVTQVTVKRDTLPRNQSATQSSHVKTQHRRQCGQLIQVILCLLPNYSYLHWELMGFVVLTSVLCYGKTTR